MRTPSPSMAVALLALFVALGGTGYAALKLPKNSVGATQLRANAVTAAKVKNGSLKSADFAKGALPAGARGPAGATGATGVAGAAGAAGPTGPSGIAGTARAYGVVKSDGTIVAAKSKNLTVSKITGDPGVYCVIPTAASGIDPTKVQPVATPDYNDGSGTHHIVQSIQATDDASPTDCPNGWEFITDEIAATSTREDIAFTVIVP